MKRVMGIASVAGLVLACWCSTGEAGQSKVQMEITGLKYAPQHYMIMFHAKPAIGQFKVIKMMMGKKSTWCIVGGKAGAWEVEERRDSFMDPKGKIVIMRIVDDKGYVSKACIAEYKDGAVAKGEALKVSPKPKKKAGEKPKKGPEVKDEAGPTVAGLKTRKITMKVGGKDSVTCLAKEALFAVGMETPSPLGGAVKSTYDGKVVLELEKQGTDKKAYKPSVTMP